jgi:hypothetical protein
MAELKKEVNSQLDLTSYEITGTLIKSDIEHFVKDFYQHQPTQLVLLDASGCILRELSAKDLEDISKLILEIKAGRETGKTAFVISKTDLGMGVLFENLAKMERLPYNYRSFTSRDEALNWLGINT